MTRSLLEMISGLVKLSLIGTSCCWSLVGSMRAQAAVVSEVEQVKKEALVEHNKWRALHQAPGLVWDDELQKYARKHALTCQFRHSATPYGENLAAGYPSIAAAIKAWYVESANYTYIKPQYSHANGHFTQLVWVSSKKLGCAYVACKGLQGTPGNYLVCEYDPAGNVINPGYFQKNVLPSKR